MRIHFNNTDSLDVIPTDSSFRYRAIMGDNNVTLYYSLPDHIEVPLGAWIEFEDQIYTLNDPANFKKNATRNFEYTLILDSDQYQLSKYKLRNNVPGDRRLKFSFTATPQEMLQLVVDNMNERDSGWVIGTPVVDAPTNTVTFNHNSCKEALQMIADAFETEWQVIEVNGQKTVYLKQVEYNKDNPYPLSYGRGNGFKPGIGRMNFDGSKPIEVLYAEGGNRNINPTAYQDYRYGQGWTVSNSLPTELLLPGSTDIWYDGTNFYDVATTGAFKYSTDDYGYLVRRSDIVPLTKEEDSIDLTNIYPMREGSVTSIIWVYNRQDYATYQAAIAAGGTAQTIFMDFVDTSIPDDLNYANYRIPGEVATVIFQSGMLAGKEFDIEQSDTALTGYDHSKRRFRLVSQEIDGQIMPNDVFSPVVGDTYGVFHIALPDEYIEQAERTMLEQAVVYLYNNQVPRFTFTGELDGIWAATQWNTLKPYLVLGGFINFSDNQFQTTPTPIRITGIKDIINKPHYPIIELSNSPVRSSVYSVLKKLETEEVSREIEVNQSIEFTKRRYQHSRELISLLEGAVEGFSEGVNPVTVQTMALLVGSENLQFTLVTSPTDTTPIPWYNVFRLDNASQTFEADDAYIRWMRPGGSISNIDGGNYTVLESIIKTYQLTDPTQAYYVYYNADIDTNQAVCYISTTAQPFQEDPTHFNLLVGIISSAIVDENGNLERSFAPLYGFTEILPGQITTDRVVSADGDTYFDLVGNEIRLNDPAESATSGLTGTGSADTSVRFWVNAPNDDRANAAFKITKDGHLYSTAADITGKIQSSDIGERFILDPTIQTWLLLTADGTRVGRWYFAGGSSVITVNTPDGNNSSVISPQGLVVSDSSASSRAGLGVLNCQSGNNKFDAIATQTTPNLIINMNGLPTSATNLGSGQVWRNASNQLMIVP